MTTTARTFLTRLAMLFIAACFALTTAGCATAYSQEQTRNWSRAELQQLLAPVALYPDALLAQLLIASTYPDEIVEAARWSRMHPELEGEDVVRAADAFDWDPSVKSLLAFPDLLGRMDERIDWTRGLGDAFLAQEEDVMDAVQDLRRRAALEGSIANDDHVRIVDEGHRIQILFASPGVVYLPYYDPRVIYGRWWWPSHPPVVWAPWPRYRFVPRAPGMTVGFWWSPGVRLSVGFFFGGIDWPRRQVQVVRVDTWYVHRAIERRTPQRVVVIKPGRWHHEPTRRHVGPRPEARAPQHEARRTEVRQPERHPQEVRRPEVRAAQREQTRPEPREARGHPQPVARPILQRETRRPEAQRQQASADPREGRERSSAAPQRGPQRPEARGAQRAEQQRETHRPEVQRPQASAAAREGRERPGTTTSRGAQRPESRREARGAERGSVAEAQPRQPQAQPAERGGPRSAPEQRPQG